MDKLEYLAEKYAAMGGISAEGAGKLLGVPTHSRLHTLIREAVQNVWDARRKADPSHDLRCRIELRQLTARQRGFLKETIFGTLPADPDYRGELKEKLESEQIDLLTISDFGTTGLDGPDRPNISTGENEPTNYVDFVCNIGSPRDQELGGGTYGFGKSALFNFSSVKTCLIYSAINGQRSGSLDHRFIVTGLSAPFDKGRSRYTGRHFWGQKESRQCIPAAKTNSKRAAKRLGFDDRNEHGTGTTLGILFPILEEEELSRKELGREMASAILWYFWPKFLHPTDRIKFEVLIDGQEIAIPDVYDVPRLRPFAEAYKKIYTDQGENIECRSPIQHLGKLALVKQPVLPNSEIRHPCPELDKAGQLCHVALMRPAELIVKYLKCDEFPVPNAEYGGVFRCDEDEAVESAFKNAEPPAHDAWETNYLTGREKTYVNVGLREIKNRATEFVQKQFFRPGQSSDAQPLGLLSEKLGSLLYGTPGGGAAIPESGSSRRNGGARGSRRPTVDATFSRFEDHAGTKTAIYRIEPRSGGMQNCKVLIEPQIPIMGGTTKEPVLARRPEILECKDNHGVKLDVDDSRTVNVDFSNVDYLEVVLTLPDNCSIQVNASVEIEHAE